MRRALLLLLLSLLATPAWADRREVYVELEPGLGVHLLADGATTAQASAGLGPEGQLHAFYGLTNALHLGGYVRGYYAPDVAFANVTPTLPDGSQPTGTLYENAFGVGAGALVRWRFDTGYALAPFAQLELGAGWSRYVRQQLIPTGRTFGIDLPPVTDVAPDGRVLLGLEYRLGDHFVLALHLGARGALSRYARVQLDAALASGVVF